MILFYKHLKSFVNKINSESIRDLFSSLKANKTYCFSTDTGPFGWCATCDVDAKKNERGYCAEEVCRSDGKCTTPPIKNPEELMIPSLSKVN